MDHAANSPSGQSSSASFATWLDRLSPYALSILRIVAALLFLEHGTSKFFDFPQVMEPFPVFSMEWFAGLIEFAGGILVALGLFTRAAALIMSGEMAIGYFLFHATLSHRRYQSRWSTGCYLPRVGRVAATHRPSSFRSGSSRSCFQYG